MANVTILKVGHALIAGARGEKGGAPSKDSVFGVATVQGNVVSFGGRRGGVLRFKTYKKADMDKVLAKFDFKLTGKDKGFAYNELDEAAQAEVLGATFNEVIGKGFYKAMSAGKLNTLSTKGRPVKAKKVEEVGRWVFPTAASMAAKAQAAA